MGFSQPVGWGYVETGQASVIDNFPSAREDFFYACRGMIHEAKGVYKKRIFETFNPLYWIEAVINMPREVLTYFGLSAENVITKIAQVLWWTFGVIASFTYALYKPQVDELVKKLIERLSTKAQGGSNAQGGTGLALMICTYSR